MSGLERLAGAMKSADDGMYVWHAGQLLRMANGVDSASVPAACENHEPVVFHNLAGILPASRDVCSGS